MIGQYELNGRRYVERLFDYPFDMPHHNWNCRLQWYIDQAKEIENGNFPYHLHEEVQRWRKRNAGLGLHEVPERKQKTKYLEVARKYTQTIAFGPTKDEMLVRYWEQQYQRNEFEYTRTVEGLDLHNVQRYYSTYLWE